MNIQVIIPVYKPDKKLIKLIERLKNQTLTPHGINLIHSAGDEPDETVELVKKEFPDIRIMEIRVSLATLGSGWGTADISERV